MAKRYTVVASQGVPELDRRGVEIFVYRIALAMACDAWRKNLSEWAVRDAITLVRQCPALGWPEWLIDAMATVLVTKPEQATRGRTGNPRARRRANLIDAIRADVIDRALDRGLSLRAACREASAVLQGDPAGTPKVMQQSHRRVQDRVGKNAADYYPLY